MDLVDLPAELLGPISDKLHVIQDLVRFGAVCLWWRELAVKKENVPDGHPWLMLANDGAKKRKFYSPTRGELFELELRHGLFCRCWGSPFGLVVGFSENLGLSLFNPLSGASIVLSSPRRMLHRLYTSIFSSPPRNGHDDLWFRSIVSKFILTAPPHSPNSYLFSISFKTRTLGFLKLGATTWTTIDVVELWTDIVCFQGTTFFGCLQDATLLTLDMSSQTPKALLFAPPPPPQDMGDHPDGMNYLVELPGELCMVVRCGGVPNQRHLNDVEFRVFRMDMSTRRWTRIMSLGGHCLFLGANYSYAVQSSDQLKPDCIYFTSDDHNLFHYNYCCSIRGSVTGIYDVFKGEATALTPPPSVAADDMTSPYCPPIWFTPRLS